MLPACPKYLPQNILDAAATLIKTYADSEVRPRLNPAVATHWSKLISEWSNSDDLPLLIRKQAKDKGKLLTHRTGRKLAPCDNSPANWSIWTAFAKGVDFNITDVKKAFEEHEIPVALTMSKSVVEESSIKGLLKAKGNANKMGWKVDHLDDVGLKVRTAIEEIDIEVLKSHFKRLMDPLNIVLVPSTLRGLGDMPSFVEYIKKHG